MLLIYICVLARILSPSYSIIVQTNLGLVNGTKKISRNGTPYHAFYGIPYAAPPVGPLRFKVPIDPPSWIGVRQAIEKAPICFQGTIKILEMKSTYRGQEDCLYMSVFTRDTSPSKLVPVLVFIHGGAFQFGNGDSRDVSPLMDKSIVVVTFNYRLGIFGFFSSGDNSVSGNYGLKDQVAALKWVQKNIQNFGGDPSSVTIMGQSSGSVCVHLHILSPLSKGLFHRAIMESGTAFTSWAYSNEKRAKETYADTIKMANCTSNNIDENIKCLQSLSVKNMEEILLSFSAKNPFTFHPFIENSNRADAFLIGDPHNLSPQNPDLPIIIGFTSAEGRIEVLPLLKKYPNMTELDIKLNEFIPSKLHYSNTKNPELLARITKMLKQFYFPNGIMAKGQEQNLCNLMSDIIFNMPIINTAISYPGPKFVYVYDYENSVEFSIFFNKASQRSYKIRGAGHSDDLLSLFYIPNVNEQLSTSDIQLSEQLITYWINFASSGNPNVNENVPTTWQAANTTSLYYMHITNNGFNMKSGLLEERYTFWKSIPLSHL